MPSYTPIKDMTDIYKELAVLNATCKEILAFMRQFQSAREAESKARIEGQEPIGWNPETQSFFSLRSGLPCPEATCPPHGKQEE